MSARPMSNFGLVRNDGNVSNKTQNSQSEAETWNKHCNTKDLFYRITQRRSLKFIEKKYFKRFDCDQKLCISGFYQQFK